MNKTVNINLGGMFFHIDEDAYQKLTRYFDAIKRSLSNSSGQDEIIRDIEMRIGELITERHTSDKQVINIKEVDEIIGIMGQPEDYRIEDDASAGSDTFDTAYMPKRKKLYRDADRALIGGVCTGLGHYFGVDTVWIRIIFAILFFGFGIGLIPYIILWIAMPAAVTTSEKLEMTGEPVTISNIQKKVREEMDYLSEKYRNTDIDRLGKQAKTGAERIASNLGDVFSSIFKVFAKILGAIIAVFAGLTLLAVVIGLFLLLASIFVDVPGLIYAESANYTAFPMGLIVLLGLLAAGIPFFFLFLLGLNMLSNNSGRVSNPVKYTLLALWLISVAVLTIFGIKQASETTERSKVVQKQEIMLQPNDTLSIGFRYNDYFAKDIYDRSDLQITQDEQGKDIIYSNNVHVSVRKSPDKTAYILVEKRARGKSRKEARDRAEKITYKFSVEGSKVMLDNYLVTGTENKLRNQEVEIFVYLPAGVLLKPDESFKEFDYSDDDFFNLHFSGNYLYRVTEDKVMCLNCPPEENEFLDIEGAEVEIDTVESTTVRINKDGVTIDNHGSKEDVQTVKTLRINKDGVVVKTK
ncbi:Phage shock protein PspC N-terminal domain-containing protein [Flavobacterium longum]|uniref:PspC domain-containing protein n=1 Tax=Flavobacterium longum TaxID=1299340 RepID=UPI0039EAFD63